MRLLRSHPRYASLPFLVIMMTVAAAIGAMGSRFIEHLQIDLAGENLALMGALVCVPMIVALLWTTRRLRKESEQAHEEGAGDKAADSTLRETLERTRLILDSTLNAVAGMNMQGSITDWNARAEAMFGWTQKEVLGRKLAETIIPPRYRDAHERGFQRFLASGEGPLLNRRVEMTALRRDGTEFPIELTISPLKMGESYVFSSFIADITERKQAERALLQSEERFRSAFGHAAIGMALVSIDGRWLQVNQALCDIVGYSEQELLAKTFQAITHPDDLEADLNYVRRILAGEIRYYQMEKRYLHKHGHAVWILLSVSLVRDGEGHPLHFIGLIKDITERKQAEDALRSSERVLRTVLKEREQLAQDLHDGIIQSLYAIGMSIEESRRLMEEDPEKARLKLGQEITDVNAVIRAVRSHLVQGKDDLPFSASRFKAELTRVAGTMERANALHFRLKVDQRAAECLTTEERREILYIAQEAMSNCLRHSGASIANVSLRLARDRVCLEVEDDGMGFDKKNLHEANGGLRNIERRAAKVGAKMEIVSHREHGTRIRLDVPIHT